MRTLSTWLDPLPIMWIKDKGQRRPIRFSVHHALGLYLISRRQFGCVFGICNHLPWPAEYVYLLCFTDKFGTSSPTSKKWKDWRIWAGIPNQAIEIRWMLKTAPSPIAPPRAPTHMGPIQPKDLVYQDPIFLFPFFTFSWCSFHRSRKIIYYICQHLVILNKRRIRI